MKKAIISTAERNSKSAVELTGYKNTNKAIAIII
jgi:hypothetical protein